MTDHQIEFPLPADDQPYTIEAGPKQSVEFGCAVCGKLLNNDEYVVIHKGSSVSWFCTEHGHNEGDPDPLRRCQELSRKVLEAVEVLGYV